MTSQKNSNSASSQLKPGKRIRTRYVGIYSYLSTKRLDPDGHPDKCYYFSWCTKEGKMKWEKVGWKSEGYSIEDAIELRGIRIKSNRHPELIPPTLLSPPDSTLDEVWEIYKTQWLPRLDGAQHLINRYDRYLKPKFGSFRISQITTLDIQNYTNELLSAPSLRKLEGLEASTVNTIIGDLRRIIKKAHEWKLYKGELPIFHKIAADDKRKRFLRPEEAYSFLLNLQFIDKNLYYIAKIALFTGMRLNEILNIKKEDINFDYYVIEILKRKKKKGKRIDSKRCAFFSEELYEDLKCLCIRKTEYIFVRANGNRWSVNKISSIYSHLINAMGYNKGITDRKYRFVFHTLRHTFCSWLANAGVSLYIISELAGHDPEMAQRYAKFAPGPLRSAITNIGKVLYNNN